MTDRPGNVVAFSESYRARPKRPDKHEDEPTARVILLPIIRIECGGLLGDGPRRPRRRKRRSESVTATWHGDAPK